MAGDLRMSTLSPEKLEHRTTKISMTKFSLRTFSKDCGWYVIHVFATKRVMGRSGAGKSSVSTEILVADETLILLFFKFINLASNSSLKIGEGLESCTERVEMSEPFQLEPNGRYIRLIDTPGFDDSFKSDADILNTIATFLVNEYVVRIPPCDLV